MKKLMVVFAVMAFVMTMGNIVMAADTTTTVKSTASIANVCELSGTGAIAFGPLDQISGAAVSNVAATGYTLWCTNGYSAAISVDGGKNSGSSTNGGTRYLKNNGNTDTIPYTLAWATPVVGAGKSNDIMSDVDLKGTIAAGAYADVSAGSYEDTVTITISY